MGKRLTVPEDLQHLLEKREKSEQRQRQRRKKVKPKRHDKTQEAAKKAPRDKPPRDKEQRRPAERRIVARRQRDRSTKKNVSS